MPKLLPEYDKKYPEKIRDVVIGTVPNDIGAYKLTVASDDTINFFINDNRYKELARRWHIKRLPQLEVSGECEMIVCPYCCKEVMLESCRIDHVIPWKKYTLYNIITKAYSILEKQLIRKKRSSSRTTNELIDRLNKLSGKIKEASEEYFISVANSVCKKNNTIRTGSNVNNGRTTNFNVVTTIDAICKEINISDMIKTCFQDEGNMLVCCHECNANKSDRLIESKELSAYLTKMKIAAIPEEDIRVGKLMDIIEDIDRLRSLPYYFYSLIDMNSNLFKLLNDISNLELLSDGEKLGDEINDSLKSLSETHSFWKSVKEDDENHKKTHPEERKKKYLDGMVCLYLTRVYKNFMEETKRPSVIDGKKGSDNDFSATIPIHKYSNLPDFIDAHPKIKKLGVKNFANKFEAAYSSEFRNRYISDKIMSSSQRVRLTDYQLKSSGKTTFVGKICFYCLGVFESFAFEIDHISPALRINGVDITNNGVKNSLKNLIPVCKTCNASKSSKRLTEDLLQEFMIRRWLDAYSIGMENSSLLTKSENQDVTDDIKNLFSKAIADFTSSTRHNLLFGAEVAKDN